MTRVIKRLLFVALVFFMQCGEPYEDDARLLIKGQVIDENNQPIPNANIRVFIRGNDFDYNTSEETLLGESSSSSDGSFAIVTFLGKDDNFVIEVHLNDNFTRYIYKTDTDSYIPDDYLIDLQTVSIRQKAVFNYSISRVSPEGTTLDYSFQYLDSQCIEIYDEGVLNEDESFCFENRTSSRTLDDDRPDFSDDFASTIGSEVVFTYSVNGQPAISETVVIDETNTQFQFSY